MCGWGLGALGHADLPLGRLRPTVGSGYAGRQGRSVDRYIVELAEWGARLVEKSFLLEESEDNHPMAWQRIIDPVDGSEVDTAVTMKLWQQTRKHLAGFPGRTRVIDERQ